ncbi:helix-turn-helix transcriptional regulator, partial [bacterium]|nr:helix-turn-helix transcriptional regulator [bacterium]
PPITGLINQTPTRTPDFMEKELQELKELHQFYLYYDYKTGEIARELNVSTRTVQRWLSGKAIPSEEKLKQIRKLLNKKRRNL